MTSLPEGFGRTFARVTGDSDRSDRDSVLPYSHGALYAQKPVAPATIAFVDSSIDGWQDLVAGIGPDAELILIPQTGDALGFMSDVLAGRSNVGSVHILSHGGDGYIAIGTQIIDNAALAASSTALAGWSAALTGAADILLYGCHVGAGANGQSFMDSLARLTGADVAASSDLTGAAARGGNWTLEVQSGQIETAAFDLSTSFGGTLGATYSTTYTTIYSQAYTGPSNEVGPPQTLLFDVDGDGDLDLLMLPQYGVKSIYKNDGDGNFTAFSTFGSGRTFEAKAADLNGDGISDLMVRPSDGKLQIYMNNGTGTFSLSASLGSDTATHNDAFVYGDLDGDGDIDIVVGIQGTSSVYLNNGTGTFTAGGTITNTTLESGRGVIRMALADLDRDGDLDLAIDVDTVNVGNASTTLFINNGAGSFSSSGVRIGSAYSGGIYVADFNNDGFDDLYQVSDGLTVDRIYYNNGTFNLTPSAANPLGFFPNQPFDVDNDGDVDFASGSTVYVNNGSGSFTATPLTFPHPASQANQGDTTYISSTGDIDGDGDADAIVVSQHYTYDWFSNPASYTMEFTLAWYVNQLAASTAPEIAIEGNGTEIDDGDTTPSADDHTAFGTTNVTAGTIVRTFTIANTGDAALTISSVTVTGANSGDFTVTSSPASSVAPNGSTTFQVTFDPGASGTRTATITVNNNDSDEAVYDFAVSGVGNAEPAVNANAGLTVAEGATGTVTAALLDFDDAEQADSAITYTVTSAATNGTLYRSNVALTLNSTFTQADINAGLITYRHDGGETTSASFGFSVSDGQGGVVTGQTFSFTVTPVNDAPTVINGSTVTLAAVLEDVTNPAGATVASLFGSNFSDVDGDSFAGIMIGINNSNVSQGVWQVFTGGEWSTLPALSPTNTYLVSAADSLRFLPAADYAGTPGGIVTLLIDNSAGPVITGTRLDSSLTGSGGATIFSNSTVSLGTSVTPVNDAPTAILGTLAVNEYAGNDTVVGTLSATDPDSSSFTYTLLDDAGGRFKLVDNEVQVADGLLLDHEQAATHTIRVEVTDDLGATFEQDLTVTVGDVSPEFVTGDSRDNRFVGDIGNDTLKGAGGDDTLEGAGGNDTIYGDDGSDLIFGGDGDDALYGGDYFSKGVGGDDTLEGGAGNDTLTGGLGVDHLLGGAGNDTYIDPTGDTIVELAGEGTDTVISSTSFTLLSLDHVENLTLTGTADINATGNLADNVLTGNDGANRLRGGQGADTLIGGLGNDTYVDPTGDVIIESADGGADTVESSQTFSLIGIQHVENLTLTGTANINGRGNYADNVITGNSGNNRLDGSLGADTLIGGLGDDTYVNPTGDTIIELAGGGTDTVESNVTFNLTGIARVERLVLTGTAHIDGTGNGHSNEIVGNSGDNRLSGLGGADTLIGGLGNDTYVNPEGDLIVELAGQGTDTVENFRSFNLAGLTSVENLVLTGVLNSVGQGNELDNHITGNSGNNLLRGGDGNDTLVGGEGVDTLNGGMGDDTYVDPAGDTIVEGVDWGNDTIVSSITATLSGRHNVENLTLSGSADTNATGNSYDNVLRGNDGANRLDGRGGADTLIGGAGNDVYVDPTGDTIIELAGGGVDTVESSVTFLLSGIAHVENLVLTGTANINGTGNYGDNVLIGNSGANRLRGSLGSDTIDGGGGADTYVFGAVAESNGAVRDVILNADLDLQKFDFNAGIVNLVPSSIAASVTTGALNEASFEADLAAAIGAGQLGIGQALLFTASSGDLAVAGQSFLVLDVNGIAGYQAGQDYVVQLSNHTGALTLDDFI